MIIFRGGVEANNPGYVFILNFILEFTTASGHRTIS